MVNNIDLSDGTKILIVIACILLLVHYYMKKSNKKQCHKNKKIHKKYDTLCNGDSCKLEKFTPGENYQSELPIEQQPTQQQPTQQPTQQQPTQQPTQQDYASKQIYGDNTLTRPVQSDITNIPLNENQQIFDLDPTQDSGDKIARKMVSKNSADNGKYKNINYSGGERGTISPSEWEQFYINSNNLVGGKDSYKDKFHPVDEPNNNYAACNYKLHSCKEKPEEIFDIDKLLPREAREDWFEVMPEPISVKNRHLINVTRPISINTIGTSLKNPSYDLRGSVPCPKFVISPWLQSSIEPDTNIKSFA